MIVIGAARQGTALARYLVGEGAKVILNDIKSADQLQNTRHELADIALEWVLGEHPLDLLEEADMVCPSGGVPLTMPLIEEAVRRQIVLSNDSQIFLETVLGTVIGITGSAGKTTTTTLVGRIAQAEVANNNKLYQAVYVGGNIGFPLISEVDSITAKDLIVMEFSSFQLDLMRRSPHVAALLNIMPNHLDRHGTMESYQKAKLHIMDHQSAEDIVVLGREDALAWGAKDRVQGRLYSFGLSPLPEGQFGSYMKDNQIWLRTEDGERTVMSVSDVSLRGEHNLLNVLAACVISAAADLFDEAMKTGVSGFAGVPHRLEFVRTWGGADWYNDSKATGPASVISAIQAFDEPLILLAGGRDKKLPWDQFAELVRDRVDHLILFGEAAPIIEASLIPGAEYTLDMCNGLDQAVKKAAQLVETGDVVLLSPGGVSFDEFINFEERGERFKEWVHQLEE